MVFALLYLVVRRAEGERLPYIRRFPVDILKVESWGPLRISAGYVARSSDCVARHRRDTPTKPRAHGDREGS